MEEKKSIYIIYHKADLDGLFGARACGYPHQNDILIGVPMQYGDELPYQLEDMAGHRVYIVDFSLPTEQMERLNNNADLYRFDHHISAIKDNEHLEIKGKRDTKQAGCRLAFHYHPEGNGTIGGQHNNVINLISDYDIRNKTDLEKWENEILPFQYGMRLEVGLDLDKVIDFMNSPFDVSVIKMKGKVIMDNNKIQREQWMRKSGDITIEYFVKDKDNKSPLRISNKGLALLGPAGGSSQVFESKRDNTIYDVMVYITYNMSKKEFSVSLYSDKDTIDCSAIAKYFGGGGHKGASGFVCKTLPFKI